MRRWGFEWGWGVGKTNMGKGGWLVGVDTTEAHTHRVYGSANVVIMQHWLLSLELYLADSKQPIDSMLKCASSDLPYPGPVLRPASSTTSFTGFSASSRDR